MSTRVSRYVWDSFPVTVHISGTFAEAFDAITQDMRKLLETHREVTLEVYSGKDNLAHLNLHARSFGEGVRVHLREAPPASDFSRYPRAEVSLYGTTWAGTDENGDFVSWNDVNEFWEISVCPPGMDPRVHQTAETLLWDAQEQAQVLTLDDAITIAQALFRETISPRRG